MKMVTKNTYPKPINTARAIYYNRLPKKIWEEKYRIVTEIYGFGETGFEAKTTPKSEAFWKFKDSRDAGELDEKEVRVDSLLIF